MGDMNVWFDDTLEQKLRYAIMKVYGLKRGKIQDAFEDMAKTFLEKYKDKIGEFPDFEKT